MAITFNGNIVPTGIEVSKITKPVLPPIEVDKINIAGRDGSFNLHKKFLEREMTIEFVIKASSASAFATKVRELADFLYTEEPQQLFFTNEPTKYYMAMVEDITDIEDVSDTVGTVSVTFRCSQPFSFDSTAQVPVSLNTNGTTTTVTNNGDVDSFPTFEVAFIDDSTFIGLQNGTTGESMIIGTQVRLGEDTPYYPTSNVYAGTMANLGDWTQIANGTANKLDLGDITAQHVLRTTTIAGSSQTGYGLASGSYGVGASWHGAVSEYDASGYAGTLDDWSITWDVQYNGAGAGTTARTELYLFDDTGNRIAKLNIQDSNNGSICPQLWFKLYKAGGGWQPTSTYDIYSGTTGSSSLMTDAKYRNCTHYYNPTGLIRVRIAKRGQDVRIWIAYIDPTDGNHSQVLKQDLFQYKDVNGEMTTGVLDLVRLSTLTYGTTTDPTELICHTCRIDEEHATQTGIPYLFENGDKLIIDSGTAMILLNGEPFFTFLDPTSDFPKLVKGNNELLVVGDVGKFSDAQIIKNERYL